MKLSYLLVSILVLSGCDSTNQEKDAEPSKTSQDAISTKSSGSNEAIDWTTRYSPDVAYYNTSSSALKATATEDPESKVVGMIEPGGGGFISACSDDVKYCQVSFGGKGLKGYVDMTAMGGKAY